MHNEPRSPELDAKFIEAGGLKNWGCFALLLSALALLLLFIILRVLLTGLIGATAGLWGALVFVAGVVAGAVYLWFRSRRRRRLASQADVR